MEVQKQETKSQNQIPGPVQSPYSRPKFSSATQGPMVLALSIKLSKRCILEAKDHVEKTVLWEPDDNLTTEETDARTAFFARSWQEEFGREMWKSFSVQ